MFRRKQLDEVYLKNMEEEVRVLEKLEALNSSEHGKFLLQMLGESIEATTDEEDKKDIFTLDTNARDMFFCAVRSKRQTLKALKKMVETAQEKKQILIQEIQKYIGKEN